jgi:hypothetical protein
MITFTILLIALLIFSVIAAFCIVAGGAGIILIFGDLVICGAIIWLLIRLFRQKK